MIPGDVLILSGEDGLKTTQLITNIYGRAEWPKNFTSVSRTALKKKSKATKCSDHHIVRLTAHTAKMVARRLRRRIEKEI